MAREGQALLHGAPLIHPDSWSWDPQPWDFIPTSPAWELLAGGFWNLGQEVGLFALTAATVAFCLSALAWIARSMGASPTATVIAILICGSLGAGILTARAGLPAFVLLLLEFALAWRFRRRLVASSAGATTVRAVVLSFAFASLGIWLHNSWSAFGFIAIGGLGLMFCNPEFGALRQRRGLVVGVAIGSILGMASGPLGVEVWANSLRVGRECQGLIKEWTSPWQIDGVWVGIWCVAAAMAVSLSVSALRRRKARWLSGPEVPLLLLTIGGVVAGATAVRFLLLGIFAAMPLLAVRLSRGSVATATLRIRQAAGERAHEPYWRNIVALLAVMALPLFIAQAALTPRGPDAAISALPNACNLFSDDWIAKPVELWRPDIKVWIDGRQDYWGRNRLIEDNRYLAHSVPNRLVPPGTSCVLLDSQVDSALARAMASSDDWQRLAKTDNLTAWARKT